MPNYILVSFFILININIGFSQYEKRKIGVNKSAIAKIVNQKIASLAEDVAINQQQVAKIKKIYTKEVYKIDSLKFQSPEFFEDPIRGREIILQLKFESESKVMELLSLQQKRTLFKNRETKKKKAFERLSKQ